MTYSGISHGVMDYSNKHMSYFGLAQIPERITIHHIKLLEILAPHLHVAYSRLISIKKPCPQTSYIKTDRIYSGTSIKILSQRELEVLRWLTEGKSNWEISMILKISENTVKKAVVETDKH